LQGFRLSLTAGFDLLADVTPSLKTFSKIDTYKNEVLPKTYVAQVFGLGRYLVNGTSVLIRRSLARTDFPLEELALQ